MSAFEILMKAKVNAKKNKSLIRMKNAEDNLSEMTALDKKFFDELEKDIEDEKLKKFTSGCKCHICSQEKQLEQKDEDHFGRSSEAEKKMFLLLQQLTLIEPESVPKILGAIPIPTVFFKRIRRINNFKTNPNAPKPKSGTFIMFESDQKTGILKGPRIIPSLFKVVSYLKVKGDRIRKLKFQEQQKQINMYNQTLNSRDLVIDSDCIAEEIPTYFLSSTCKKSLMENKKKPQSYIIQEKKHTQSKGFIEQESIKETEPFCLFRYQTSSTDQNAKYQIFTQKRLDIFIKKHEQENRGILNFPIVCVESFTKIKLNPVYNKNLVDGIFAMLKLGAKKQEKKIPSCYFVEYEEQNLRTEECKIFQLTKLQVLLKTDQISKFDPEYLDKFELDSRIMETIGKQSPSTEEEFKTIALYKTYKIINALKHICKVAVMELKLKWLLSENDELVLSECTEFKIDIPRSLMSKKNQKQERRTIIENGMIMLEEKAPQEQRETTDEFNELKIHLKQLIEEKKRKAYEHFNQNHHETEPSSEKIPIGKMSKSVQLLRDSRNKRIQQKNNDKIYKSILLPHCKTQGNRSIDNCYQLLEEKGKKRLKSKQKFIPINRSNRLRSFKTEEIERKRSQSIEMPQF